MRKMFEDGISLKKMHGDEYVFDLSVDNPTLEPPEAFNVELRKLAEMPFAGMHFKMEDAGYSETRAAIAMQLTRDTGIKFSSNEIVMAFGAAGAMNITFKTLLNPGEEVLSFTPNYFEYDNYADNYRGVIRYFPFNERTIKILEGSLIGLRKAIEKYKR